MLEMTAIGALCGPLETHEALLRGQFQARVEVERRQVEINQGVRIYSNARGQWFVLIWRDGQACVVMDGQGATPTSGNRVP